MKDVFLSFPEFMRLSALALGLSVQIGENYELVLRKKTRRFR